MELTVSKRNPQIDGLRAIAIIAVVLNHLSVFGFANGYLGVDLFFVISGFVVSGLIVETLKSSPSLLRFFFHFWTRRFWRLAPSLIVVVSLFYLLITLLYVSVDTPLTKTAFYSLFGLSNIWLYMHSYDYWGFSNSLNPFMHTWSLGVEEQFYLLAPIFAVIFRKRLKLGLSLIGLIILSSFILGFLFESSVNFYLLPGRVWELLLGVGVKLNRTTLNSRFAFRASLIFTFAILLIPFELNHQVAQFLITFFTCILLSNIRSGLSSAFLNNPMVTQIGIRSYVIYLVHWPIIVIVRYFSSGVSTILLSSFLMALTTEFIHKKIEIPFRFSNHQLRIKKKGKLFRNHRILVVLVPLIMLFFSNVGLHPAPGTLTKLVVNNYSSLSSPTFLHNACSGKSKGEQIESRLVRCLSPKTQNPRRIFVIGDSHADQWLPAIWEYAKEGGDVEVLNSNLENERELPFAELNGKLSQSLSFIKSNLLFRDNDLLVISFHSGYLNGIRDQHLTIGENVDSTSLEIQFRETLENELKSLTVSGGRVVFILDTPLLRINNDVRACALQMKMFGQSGCAISREQAENSRTRQKRVILEIESRNRKVSAFDPFPCLFSGETIDVLDSAGNFNFFDNNHISASKAISLVSCLAPALSPILG